MGKSTERNGKHHRCQQIGQDEQCPTTQLHQLWKVEKMRHYTEHKGCNGDINSEVSGASSQKTGESEPRGIATTGMIGVKPSAFHLTDFSTSHSGFGSFALALHLFSVRLIGGFEKSCCIEGQIVRGRKSMRALHALTARTGFHTYTENQGLLQDEHQHRREQEASKSALGIVQRHVLVGQRRSSDLLLSLRGSRDT